MTTKFISGLLIDNSPAKAAFRVLLTPQENKARIRGILRAFTLNDIEELVYSDDGLTDSQKIAIIKQTITDHQETILKQTGQKIN